MEFLKQMFTFRYGKQDLKGENKKLVRHVLIYLVLGMVLKRVLAVMSLFTFGQVNKVFFTIIVLTLAGVAIILGNEFPRFMMIIMYALTIVAMAINFYWYPSIVIIIFSNICMFVTLFFAIRKGKKYHLSRKLKIVLTIIAFLFFAYLAMKSKLDSMAIIVMAIYCYLVYHIVYHVLNVCKRSAVKEIENSDFMAAIVLLFFL